MYENLLEFLETLHKILFWAALLCARFIHQGQLLMIMVTGDTSFRKGNVYILYADNKKYTGVLGTISTAIYHSTLNM